jgi:hypothetical protein
MTIISDRPIEDDHAIPRLPLFLGLAGLVPFVVLALAIATGSGWRLGINLMASMLAQYAAVILAFLGGIRWGLALRLPASLRRSTLFVLSVIPTLTGWFALALKRPYDLAILALALLSLGLADQALSRDGTAPAWFGRLRLILTGVAVLSLAVAAYSLRA